MPMNPGLVANVTGRLRAVFARGAKQGDAAAIVSLDDFAGGSDTGLVDADLIFTSQKLWTESKSRAERHAMRKRMDEQDAIINASLDIVTDTATAPEGDDADAESFAVTCDNTQVQEEATREASILHLQEKSWEMGRRLLQYGNEMREVVTDDAAAPSRVVRYKLLPEQQMWYRQDQFGIPDEYPWEQRASWKPVGSGILFAPWQVVHYTYRADEELIYGRGMLDFEKDWQRLQAEEDGMVMARLTRAYDKYKHLVPVPEKSSAAEQEGYLRKYRDSMNKRRMLSDAYGSGQRDNPSSVTQDYFVPHPSKEHDNAGPQLLVGQNPNLQNIRDVEYMRSRVLAKLVPMRYLNIGGAEGARASLGRGSETYEDRRFGRMVRMLQHQLALGHSRVLTYHLILRGMNPIQYPITIEFPAVSMDDLNVQADIDLKRAQALQIIAALLSVPADLIIERYMGLNQEEKEHWFQELKDGMVTAAALKAAPAAPPPPNPEEIAARAAAAVAAQKNGGAEKPPVPEPVPAAEKGERAAAIRQMAESLLCLTAKELDLAQEHYGGNGGVYGKALTHSH